MMIQDDPGFQTWAASAVLLTTFLSGVAVTTVVTLLV